jgi:phytoene dehydrogenase-like protein
VSDRRSELDAVVVGAGPNGLAAAVELVRAGRSVLVVEARDTVGGGCRTAELTLPGFRHDVCSAIHPLGVASPFFRSIDLAARGVRWVHPDVPLAHPFEDGTAAVLPRSLGEAVRGLGPDGPGWERLFGPPVRSGDDLLVELLQPLRVPRHPFALARFGLDAVRSGAGLARSRFEGEPARALFCGMAAHSILPLERSPSAAFALVLGTLAHLVGWPMAEGGSQAIVDALAAEVLEAGGRIETGRRVESLEELPSARAYVLDLAPRQVEALAGDGLPPRYARALRRYRHGPGVCKVDWALDGPIPWSAPEAAGAGTVHVGGTIEELATSEAEAWYGRHAERPFVILAQQSLFDPTRAPAGRHTAWGYCHVPGGSAVDMTDRIEAQVERFAPGFRERILGRHTRTAAELERYNESFVGGDINCGVQDFRQLFTRPVVRWSPYSTPARGVYLCSAATPPGGGVHGMCGLHAARVVLRDLAATGG